MNFKKTYLLCLLFCGTIGADQVYKATWLSGVAELDAIESLKYDTFCVDINNLSKDLFDEKFCEGMKPCLTKWSKKYDKYAVSIQNSDKSSKKNKKQLKQISKKLQQDKDLSLLVKEFAEVFDAYFSDCIDEKDCAHQHLLKIMAQYFPETVDLNQVHLDYILWSHEYLEGRLHKKGSLKIEDVSYVLKQYVYYIKQHIPFSTLFSLKKSYEMWMSLVGALEKGMTHQPQDVQRYFLEKVEKCLKNSEVKTCFTSLKSMNESRQSVIKSASKNKNKSVDAGVLKEYEKSLDTSISQLSKVVKKHFETKVSDSKIFTMTEKLSFIS